MLLSRAFRSKIGFNIVSMVNDIYVNMRPAGGLINVLDKNVQQSKHIIELCRREIKGITTLVQTCHEQRMIVQFKTENKKLEDEVDRVRKELIELQIANGTRQFALPGDEVAEKKTGDTPTPKSELKPPAEVKNAESKDESSTSASSGKENKPIKTAKPKKAPAPAAEESVDVGRLDIRVGQIINAKIHPDADQLYLEQIDVGEDNPRTVVSGLVKHIPLAELDKRMVLVLCNLKPQKMRGIQSEAMVLCASTPKKVELLTPPPEAKAGDKVTVPGYTRNPDLPFMNPKKKIFEKVAEDLKVDGNKRASYKNVPWEVEGKSGEISVQTLTGCYIK